MKEPLGQSMMITSCLLENLQKKPSFTVRHYNIQPLCIEQVKVYRNITQTIFIIHVRKTICYPSNQISLEWISFNPILWSSNLEIDICRNEICRFTRESKIRMQKPNNCPCRIYKTKSLILEFWKHLNKSLGTFLTGYVIGFGPGVKRPSNFAVAWLLKNFVVFIS